MTLTIEQVRDLRFHLARRNGYDANEVDTFVDRVETTLVQLGEENATLKQQVETLKVGGDGAAAVGHVIPRPCAGIDRRIGAFAAFDRIIAAVAGDRVATALAVESVGLGAAEAERRVREPLLGTAP